MVTGTTTSVYVTGTFLSGTAARMAGTALAGAGLSDVFVAKYTDPGTGLSTTGGGALSGGSTGEDFGAGLALVSAGGVNQVYVTGTFLSNANAHMAGTALTGAGLSDVFVAKYTDPGSGLTIANGGAVSGGGTGDDAGKSIGAVPVGTTTSVYVTGTFLSGTGARLAGIALAGAGLSDAFVAQYTDAGTGLSTTGGGAVNGGGTGEDEGTGIAARGGNVYVGATTGVAPAGFGNSPALTAPASSAALARLDAGAFDYLGIEGPLQGGSSVVRATAIDPVTGDAYVTGDFTGTVGFGHLRLASAGGTDVFVAKWSAAAGAWTSAVRGGGTGDDHGQALAVASAGGVAGVYVTGEFDSNTGATFAGTPLAGAGRADVFVAKYTDPGTGLTTTNGGAVSGGGSEIDTGAGLAVVRTGSVAQVYVTGSFMSTGNARIAGTALAGAGNSDVFVAKYTDPGTGLTTTNGGAVSGGGPGADYGYGVAISGQRVYVGGSIASAAASFGSTALTNRAGGALNVLARLDDASLTPLAMRPTTPSGAALVLFPNPARAGVVVLGGAAAGGVVQVRDALGRLVATTTADASGTATLGLPAGLAAGVYLVHGNGQVARLCVE